jgi:nicotinamide-nucleotide adenylyltransferase
MVTRGIYVGRFQPFHVGHLHAIRDILEEVDEIIIVIGSAQYSHNATNPFTAGERLVMIRKALGETGIPEPRFWIVPVPDVHLHMMWVSSVVGYTPKFNAVFSNEPLTRRLFLEAGYEVKAIRFFERETHSSTLIRDKMLKNQVWEELVPRSVAAFIKEVDGVSRIQDLTRSDRA